MFQSMTNRTGSLHLTKCTIMSCIAMQVKWHNNRWRWKRLFNCYKDLYWPALIVIWSPHNAWWRYQIQTSFVFTGPLWGESTGDHKGQWRRSLMFSLMFARTNGWANTRDASNLRRHCYSLWRHCEFIWAQVYEAAHYLTFASRTSRISYYGLELIQIRKSKD